MRMHLAILALGIMASVPSMVHGQAEENRFDLEDPPIASAGAIEQADVIIRQYDQVDFPRISVDFELRRDDGAFLYDGEREDFQVTEDGQPVEIVDFRNPKSLVLRPTNILLVVDHSGSMGNEGRLTGLKRAIEAFLPSLPEGSRVGVVAFQTQINLLTPLTLDFAVVQNQVDGLYARGSTRFLDALDQALDEFAEVGGRRVILALTDGEDTNSLIPPPTVIARAQELGLPIYTLGLGNEQTINVALLQRIAEETRGNYYPAREADQLRSIYEQIAADLKAGYTLTYLTERPISDGTQREIAIRFRRSESVGTRSYYQPGMVVAQPGWSLLFLGLLVGLLGLATLPGVLQRLTASS